MRGSIQRACERDVVAVAVVVVRDGNDETRGGCVVVRGVAVQHAVAAERGTHGCGRAREDSGGAPPDERRVAPVRRVRCDAAVHGLPDLLCTVHHCAQQQQQQHHAVRHGLAVEEGHEDGGDNRPWRRWRRSWTAIVRTASQSSSTLAGRAPAHRASRAHRRRANALYASALAVRGSHSSSSPSSGAPASPFPRTLIHSFTHSLTHTNLISAQTVDSEE